MKSIVEFLTHKKQILYHGTPNKIDIINPIQAKGQREFENKNAIYLTDDKLLASLYAVSKHLKGQTTFSIFPSHKIVIVGDYNISDGYVYEVELIGAIEYDDKQWTYDKPIKDFKNIYKISKNDMDKYVIHVQNKEELYKLVNQDKETL